MNIRKILQAIGFLSFFYILFWVYVTSYTIEVTAIASIGKLIMIPIILCSSIAFVFGLVKVLKRQKDCIPILIVNFLILFVIIYFGIL